MMDIKYFIFAAVTMILLSGCSSFFEPTAEEIIPEKTENGVLPQKGTVLHLRLDYGPTTKMSVDISFKEYRYRVFIDKELYSYGVVHDYYDDVIDIPLTANDDWYMRSIVVEGSKSLVFTHEYDNVSSDEWEDWHQIYKGVQDRLKEEQPQAYPGLDSATLVFKLGNKILPVTPVKNGTTAALKQFVAKRDYVMDIVYDKSVNRWYIGDQPKMQTVLPPNYLELNETHKAGLYFSQLLGPNPYFFILLKDEHRSYNYSTPIGYFNLEDMDSALSPRELNIPNSTDGFYKTSLTISLE